MQESKQIARSHFQNRHTGLVGFSPRSDLGHRDYLFRPLSDLQLGHSQKRGPQGGGGGVGGGHGRGIQIQGNVGLEMEKFFRALAGGLVLGHFGMFGKTGFVDVACVISQGKGLIQFLYLNHHLLGYFCPMNTSPYLEGHPGLWMEYFSGALGG